MKKFIIVLVLFLSCEQKPNLIDELKPNLIFSQSDRSIYQLNNFKNARDCYEWYVNIVNKTNCTQNFYKDEIDSAWLAIPEDNLKQIDMKKAGKMYKVLNTCLDVKFEFASYDKNSGPPNCSISATTISNK